MKNIFCIFLMFAGLMSCAACNRKINDTATFQAVILEIGDGYYLVEPVEGSAERKSAGQITVPVTDMDDLSETEVGDILEIVYDGSIAESYPAQITNVYSIHVVE